MATAAQRATSPVNGTLLPFRRSTQPEPGAYRATLLNPKPLMANSKEASAGANRARRASTPNPGAAESKGKEKESQRGNTSVDSTSNGPDTDTDYNASTSFTSYETNVLHIPSHSSTYNQSRPSTAGDTSGAPSLYSTPSLLKRTRGSILVAASDALGTFKLGRRRTKTNPPQPLPMRPPPFVPGIVLPDVIEISAPRRDAEVEEREKLKEDAARAILGPAFLDNSSNPRETRPSVDGDEDERQNNHDDVSAPDEEVQSISNTDYSNIINASSMSVAKPRYRPGSMHSRNNSITPVPLPPFPSTPSALLQCTQDSATLPKYYPSTSLRIFALSKSWKSRYMILTSPIAFPSSISSGRSPSPSYLHLFKSSGADEKELERLEINEDSIVFVAEEEVAGKRHVVKVGGLDKGAMKRELNYEEDGKTMWFLQITDPSEAQKWIGIIKNAILGQRTIRAGLPSSVAQTFTNEPRGDLDVMIKMRHASANADTFRPSTTSVDKGQSLPSPTIVSSPTSFSPANSPTPITPPATAASFSPSNDADSPRKGHYDDSLKRTNTSKHSNPNYAASVSSQSIRSQATAPKSGHVSLSGNAVTALKGLFNRPRSASRASRATSLDQDREVGIVSTHVVIGGTNHEEGESVDGSFSSVGNSLLGMLKSPDGRTLRLGSSSGSGTPQRHHTMLPFSGGPMFTSSSPTSASGGLGMAQSQLERKIVPHPDRQSVVVEDPPAQGSSFKDRAAKSLSLGALSLQPPPRKRWTTSGGLSPAEPTIEHTGLYHHVNGNSSVAGSFGLGFSLHDRPATQPMSDSSPTVSGQSMGTPEQRPRAPSIQSVSTFASTGDVVLERSSTSTKRSNSMKRWSRQGSTMLSVPSPPSMPHAPSHGSASSSSPSFSTSAGRVHPYAVGGNIVDRPPSRTSTRSVASEQSVVSGLPTFSKRTSTSSAISINLNSGAPQSHAYNSGFTSTISRITNPHRASMPPPRPAPTSALPPAPNQDQPANPATPPKSSFRETVTQRALRLSRMAPAPPPPTSLPPRPDELSLPARGHRRTSSAGSGRTSSELYSIPSSPLSVTIAPPYPPPSGPLPPTPNGTASPPTRHASLKQRLRILSAPSQSTAVATNGNPNPSPFNTAPLLVSSSQPATPIAEKIMDTSFLTITPLTPSLANPMARNIPLPPDQLAEVTSLSPPPRRGSKQMSLFDKEIDGAIAPVDEGGPPVDIEPAKLSLSRHGSVISLGIVSM